jgi:hypothetical protein
MVTIRIRSTRPATSVFDAALLEAAFERVRTELKEFFAARLRGEPVDLPRNLPCNSKLDSSCYLTTACEAGSSALAPAPVGTGSCGSTA